MLFGIIPWEHLVWAVVVSMPIQFLTLYLEMRILDGYHMKAFWAIEGVLAVALFPFRVFVPSSVRLVLGIMTVTVIPVLFSRGSLVLRVSVGVAAFFLQMMGELPAALVWTALTGSVYTIEELYANLPVAVSVEVLAGVFLVIFLSLAKWFVDRFVRGELSGASFALPVVVAAAQPVVFYLATVASVRYGALDEGVFSVHIGLLVVSLVQIVALVLVCVSSDQYAAKRVADLRASALAEGVDDQLRAYSRVVARIEGVAKVRHDLRNQVQSARLAFEMGERERARAQIEEMLNAVRKTASEGSGEGDGGMR